LTKGEFSCIIIKTADSRQQTADSRQQTADSRQQTAGRILWIDFAKVIGIWLVYLGHSKVPSFTRQYIYAFHMPLFFFISGYLEKKKNIGKTLIHGIKMLIIPYVLLYMLIYLTWLPSRIVFHGEMLEEKKRLIELFFYPMAGIINAFGLDKTEWTVVFGASWFLITLFYIKIVHAVIRRIIKEKLIIYLLCNVPMVILLVILKNKGIGTILRITNVFMAFPFFSLGYYIKEMKPFANHLRKIENDNFLKVMLAIMIFLTIGFMSWYNGYGAINPVNYGKNILVYYVTALLGIALIIILSTYYKQNNEIIKILSNGTLFIMAFELPFMGIVLRLSGLQYQELGIIIHGGISTVALLLTIFPLKIVQKYIPIIIGGRK
jgi:fucose 4-O-acetylase-like acetyltransferase